MLGSISLSKNWEAGSEASSQIQLLRLAVEWEIIPINPVQGVKSPRVPAGRVRYLQPTEMRSLLEACPHWSRPLLRGLLYRDVTW